jgi:hypothetical protein
VALEVTHDAVDRESRILIGSQMRSNSSAPRSTHGQRECLKCRLGGGVGLSVWGEQPSVLAT